MGAVAAMLRDQGYTVTGSDDNVYPPMSTFLAGKGIAIQSGYRPENLPGEEYDQADKPQREDHQPEAPGKERHHRWPP